MTHANDQYTRTHKVPPSAAQTVCVDFDGTILPWGALVKARAPFPGAVEALTALRAAGYRIVILTARLSPSWCRAEAEARNVDPAVFAQQQLDFVLGTLGAYGVPFDLVTAEKVPALAYIDDKAIRVASEPGALLRAVADFLAEEAAA